MQHEVERAIGDFLARVCASADAGTSSIAVAYSGGLDSTILLYIASRYAAARNLSLFAFHVHHGLSGNADAWVEHCKAQADQLNVPLIVGNVQIAGTAKRGVEEAARIARYGALGEMSRARNVSLLLMAHHRDDQAETVLLQLMRGAGLPGLSGMAEFQPRHELLGADVALGRPLLGLSKRELERASLDFNLSYVTDESNTDPRYRRNAFRRDIAPAIEMHFPGFSALVSRAASHARTAQSLLSELALIDYETCKSALQPDALDLARARGLPDERFENLLRHWLYTHGVQLPSTSRLHEIRSQMLDAASDKHPFFDFGPVRLHRVADCLELHPNLGVPPCEPITLEWRGEPEMECRLWHARLIFEKSDGPGLAPDKLRSGQLTLRPRIGRERVKLAPNRPSKSLKHLFQESMIAPWKRDWLPLLYVEDDLVFAAGLGMDVRYFSQEKGIILRWESA